VRIQHAGGHAVAEPAERQGGRAWHVFLPKGPEGDIIIGIEISGDFHSFHCHDISTDLTERFGLTLNEYGLFEGAEDWKPIMDYMNDENNGFEPVPWFVCKTKLINEAESEN
jgi:hypothetical protein